MNGTDYLRLAIDILLAVLYAIKHGQSRPGNKE